MTLSSGGLGKLPELRYNMLCFFLFFPRVDLERDVIGVVEGSSSDFVPEEVIVSRHC